MKDVPSGTLEEALKHIEKLDLDIFGPEASDDILEEGRADKAAYQQALADQLKSLSCSGDKSASYVVRGPAIISGLGHLVEGARVTPVRALLLEAG
jgi:hypothetical protein